MKRNGDVKLAAIPPAAAAILKLTRVDRLFETFDNPADAVNSFPQFSVDAIQQPLGQEYSIFVPATRRNGFGDSRANSENKYAGSKVTSTTGVSGHWLRRQIAGCLVMLLLSPFASAATFPQQEMNSDQQSDSATPAKARPQDSDSSAKTVSVKTSQDEALPNSPGSVRSQAGDEKLLASGQQPSPKPDQSFAQEPEGTAVAQPVIATGVAASRPAGAAIAPAKQRRARSILIKVGVILGTGAAVGTVVALSSASPSRPR